MGLITVFHSGSLPVTKVTPKIHGPSIGDSPKLVTPMNCLKEWAEVTAWHCINSVYKAKNHFTRFAWLLVVSFASFLAFFQSGYLLQAYLTDSTWITSVTYEMPEDGGLDWPNITICDLDFLYKPVLEAAGITDPYQIASAASMNTGEGILFYKNFQEESPIGNVLSDNETVTRTEVGLDAKMAAFSNVSLRDLLMKYSIPCRNTVLHCGLSDTFSLHKNTYNCCGEYPPAHDMRPGCFTIQPTRVFGKSYKRIGNENAGIYFLLNANIKSYYNKLILDVAPSAGFRLYFYFGELDASSPETVLLAPGTHTMVTLVPEKVRTVALDSQIIPFYKTRPSCISDYQYRYVDHDAYSRPLCVTDCWVTWEINEFNCTVTTVRLKEKKDCRDLHGMEENQTEKWNKTYQDGFNLYTCIAGCREECESSNVDAKTSQAIFPAAPKLAAFTTYLNRAYPSSDVKYTEADARQLIYLELFYKSIQYRVVTVMEKTTIGQFISNIGGALSVWTGLSLLSLFQALVYWTQFITLWLRRVFERRSEV